jgi:hypothetical protein
LGIGEKCQHFFPIPFNLYPLLPTPYPLPTLATQGNFRGTTSNVIGEIIVIRSIGDRLLVEYILGLFDTNQIAAILTVERSIRYFLTRADSNIMPDSCQCSRCDSPGEMLCQRDDRTPSPITNRRQFLRYVIGAGVMTTATLIDPGIAKAEKKVPKALVLSCIDYRILEAERYFLSLQNLGGQYDFTALAGASLALSGLPHQSDAEAFWDQLEISYRLHQIKKVMILDHEDCSAFQYKIDPNLANSAELELTTHTEYLSRAYWAIRDRYPDLNIELYFVKLNTEVKQISPLAKGGSQGTGVGGQGSVMKGSVMKGQS